jgi:diamine N-acetyltransferase
MHGVVSKHACGSSTFGVILPVRLDGVYARETPESTTVVTGATRYAATAAMPTVQLRDIATDADRRAVLALRRGRGQDRYLGSMESHFEDAEAEPRAKPRMWSVHDGEQLVGFVMISDGIEELDEDLVGPYYLWRLLIDEQFQGRGYATATIDAVVDYLRSRPNAGVLYTSCAAGDGTPQGFYLRYGFDLTGESKWSEDILRLDLSTAATTRP